MDRRSFLTLLVASPVLAKIGKLELTPAEEPAIILPSTGAAIDAAAELVRDFRVQMYMMAFGPDVGFQQVIEAGRIARFVARPQVVLRPDRLVIQSPGFELMGVSAEGVPQLDEVVPSDFFGVAGYGSRLEWHTVRPGADLVMAVRNCGPTRPFHACLMGRTVVAAPPVDDELDLDLDELDRDYEANGSPEDDELERLEREADELDENEA